jgi:hypothetical protein
MRRDTKSTDHSVASTLPETLILRDEDGNRYHYTRSHPEEFSPGASVLSSAGTALWWVAEAVAPVATTLMVVSILEHLDAESSYGPILGPWRCQGRWDARAKLAAEKMSGMWDALTTVPSP